MERVIWIAVTVLLVLYTLATEILDWTGRIEVIRTYFPKFPEFLEKRAVRVVLLLVAVGLLYRVVAEGGQEKPEVMSSNSTSSVSRSAPMPEQKSSTLVDDKKNQDSSQSAPRRTSAMSVKPGSTPALPKKRITTAAAGQDGAAVGNITQGPGSIAQIGGIGNQATIIGTISPPPRSLSDQEMARLKQAVSGQPFKILILYVQNDEESYNLAKQIADTLSGAGWALKGPPSGAMFFAEGDAPPLRGMLVTWHGDQVSPGVRVSLDLSMPWGALSNELWHDFPEDFHVQPSPGVESDLIVLSIYKNPK